MKTKKKSLASQDAAAGSSAGALTVGGGVKHAPAPFLHRTLLYVMHLCFGFVSRMWEMGIVLLLAELTNNSLFFVSLAGFLSTLSQFLFMGLIGSWLDKTDRMEAVRLTLIFKLSAISAAYLLCALFSADAGAVGIFVFALPLLAAVASVSIATINQSIERDWIVVLSDNDSVWLTTTNSTMTQIDLFCATAAPAITGILFSFCSHPVAAIVLLCVNVAATFFLYRFMKHLYSSWPGLASRSQLLRVPLSSSSPANLAEEDPDPAAAASEAKLQALIARLGESEDLEIEQETAALEATALAPTRPKTFPMVHLYAMYDAVLAATPLSVKMAAHGAVSGLVEFSRSGVAAPMLAYSLLYCTVLCYGDVMVVYLRYSGVSDYWIGVTRGLNAVFGFIGAVLFPRVKERYGLRSAGYKAVWAETACVIIASSSFFLFPPNAAVVVLIIFVLFSRVGLWCFDLVVKQLAQEGIQEANRGKVNGTWGSLSALFECAGYACALILPSPDTFWILALISTGCVFCSSVIFAISNPSSNRPWQKAVFSPLSASSAHDSVLTTDGGLECAEEDSDHGGRYKVETVKFAPAVSPPALESPSSARRMPFRKAGRKDSEPKLEGKMDLDDDVVVTVTLD